GFIKIVPVKDEYSLFSAFLRSMIYAAEDKFPLAREDRPLKSDDVPDFPSICSRKFAANNASFAITEKSSLLIRIENEFWIEIEVAFWFHRVVGEEVLFVNISASKPVAV